MGGSRRTCEICGRRERYCAEKLFFARFPKQEEVCKEWVKVVGKEDLVYIPIEKLHTLRYVCEKHFGKRDFTKTRTRLKKRAVPKHNLTMPPLTERQMIGFPFHIATSQRSKTPASTSKHTLPSMPVATVTKEHEASEDLPTCQHSLTESQSLASTSKHTLLSMPVPTVTKEHEMSVDLPSTSQQAVTKSKCFALTSKHTLPSMPVPTVTKEHEMSVDLLSTSQQAVTESKCFASTSKHTLPSMPLPTVTKEHEKSVDLPSTSQQAVTESKTLASTSQYPLPSMPTATVTHEHEVSVGVPSICQQSLTEYKSRELVLSSSGAKLQEHSGSVQSKGTKRKLCDEVDATPRKKKLLKELKKTKCTLSSLKKSAQLIENLSSPVLKEIVMSALKNQKRKPQGKRWTTKNKISALAIFKRSPKTYRYLQHVIPLPSRKTLQNILKKIPVEPGINGAVLTHLTKIAEKQNTKNKLCVLLFDEIALKQRLVYNESSDKIEGYVDFGKEDERTSEIADHALVFLLQGLGKKFKQPLSFYFVKGTTSSQKLAVLIKENICAVEKTGHRIIATVCDQGPTNMGGLKLLREWSNGTENYFKVEDKEVFIMYDVPHLFKSIRNNFLNNGIMELDGKKAMWKHVIEVEEQNRAFLYLTKITPTHVRPMYRAKMRVKYAAQVLSQTVAAILKLLAQSKSNEGRRIELEETASVIEQLNKLFDFANGPSCADDIKKYIRENVSERTNHLEVWEDFEKKMSTVKFYTKNGTEARNVRCVDGWKVTLKSLRCVWHVVRSFGFKYLNLRQLNQDALENLFGLIRQHSPTDKHPTCSGFMGALKTSIVAGMTAPHGKGSNCEKDSQTLLTNFHDILFGDSQDTNIDVETSKRVAIEVSASHKDQSGLISKDFAEYTQTQEPSSMRSFPIGDDDDSIPTISLNDIEDMEIESDLMEIAQQPLVYVSGYIAYVTLKMQKNQCAKCKEAMTVSDHLDNPIYSVIELREWWKDKKSLTYPSVNLCRTIETAIRMFQDEVRPFLHRLNICQWTITIFHLYCDYSWLCNEHAGMMIKIIFVRLALILIRRQCKLTNVGFSSKEEKLADVIKKGQQL